MIWQLQEAKSRFSQMVNQAISEGPQIVTRHGEEVVVVLAVGRFRELVEPQPTLVEMLLESPLIGSGLEFTRDRTDLGRKVSL